MIPLRMDRQLTFVVTAAACLGVASMFLLTSLFGLEGAGLTVLLVECFVTATMAVILQRRISVMSLFYGVGMKADWVLLAPGLPAQPSQSGWQLRASAFCLWMPATTSVAMPMTSITSMAFWSIAMALISFTPTALRSGRSWSRFTEWRPYQHHVLGCVEGHLVPIPFNLNLQSCCPLSQQPCVQDRGSACQ